MVITFYRTMDDYRVLNKTLGTALGSAAGVLHERVSVTQLSIKVPSSFFNYITQSNYVMIDTFQKYYFLNTYEIENDCVIINLKEDVRMSFATQIRGITATVSRVEDPTKANAYLLDNQYQAKAYKKYVHRTFPNSFEDFSYILMTVG